MKKLTVFTTAVLLSIYSFAQQDTILLNFYDLIETLHATNPRFNLPDSLQGVEIKDINRMQKIYESRLAPHGDVSIMSNAIVHHSQTFNTSGAGGMGCGTIEAEWQAEGPVGTVNSKPGDGNGQMNRITFASNYDGINSKTVYAGSFYGGLWRSLNNGDNWSVVGTDLGIPQTSVSGIASSFQDTNTLFISTGLGDLRVHLFLKGNLIGGDAPNYTTGIYRSTDYGVSWKDINNGFLSNFSDGGTARGLKINPENENTLFCATTKGIFRTQNALDITPVWVKLSIPDSSILKQDFKGLQYHPADTNIIYSASGDIFKSTDAGDSWQRMTGISTGLNIQNLPDSFSVKRINLAVTPADSSRLFAYILGNEKDSSTGVWFNAAYIFMFNNNQWVEVEHFRSNGNFTELLPEDFNAIAVSPVNPNQIYYGFTKVRGSIHIDSNVFINQSPYNDGNFHADVHDLVFQPNVTNPKLFCANHGGVSIKDISNNNGGGWTYKNGGLNVSLIWTFDISRLDPEIRILGRQDCGTNLRNIKPDNSYSWKRLVGNGTDGYYAQIFNEEKELNYLHSNRNGEPGTFYYRFGVAFNLQMPIDAAWVAGDINLNPPPSAGKELVPAQVQIVEHPALNKPVFGFTELYTLPTTAMPQAPVAVDSWTIESDLYRHKNWKKFRFIKEFVIAPSDTNFVYIAARTEEDFGKYTNFYRSKTGLRRGTYDSLHLSYPSPPPGKFEDITDSLPQTIIQGDTFPPFITGVAVSSKNPEHVWVSVSGFKLNSRVFKSTDAGDTWINADPNNDLPELPANNIVYQNGSNNRLFLATDAGVYVTDDEMGCWKRFGNIPNVKVFELRTQSCSNKIYAATYGRGIWSANMPSISGTDVSIAIDTNTTWAEDKFLSTDVLIKAGATLTIKGKVYMPAHGKIKIEPNGILELDSGMITNICNKFWGGIELWGDHTKDQFPLSQPTHQAKVVLKNGAVLENARHAIVQLKEGISSAGLIQAENATFRNCFRATAFMSHTELDHSYYKNCTFEIDSNYSVISDDTTNALSQITMWDVKGVSFKGCTFINNSDIHVYHPSVGNGIFSIGAGYTVDTACISTTTPCPIADIKRTSFSNLNQGIFALGEGNQYTVDIKNTDFIDNSMAFRVEALDNIAFNKNDILAGGLLKSGYSSLSSASGFNYQFGFYSYASSGYSVTGNTFEAKTSPVMIVAGVHIEQSGSDANEIYKNTFKNNEVGEYYQGRNKNPLKNFEGLQFLCNSNAVTNEYDVRVDQELFFDGIRTLQGNTGTSAGNTFSNPPGLAVDAHIKNDAASINYYYKNVSEEPTKTYNAIVDTASSVNTCPDQSLFLIPSSGTQVPQPEIDAYYAERVTYDDLLYNYIQSLDNGNTDSLKAAIGLYFPSQAQAMRDDLIAQSPYVSTGALMDAANTGILTDALLLEVCLENPSATQAGGFLDFLEYEIPNPLPSNMIQLIYQSWGASTPRSILENQLAGSNAELGRIANQILHFYQMDSLDHYDSIVSIIESRKTLNSKYRLIELAMSKNDFNTTATLFNYIESNYTLTTWQNAEHLNFKNYIGVRQSLHNANKNYVDLVEGNQELTDLRTIAANNTGRSSALAQSILCFVVSECSNGGSSGSLRIKSYPKRVYDMTKPVVNPLNNSSFQVELHPNPTSAMVQLNISGLKAGQVYVFQVSNLQGQKVMEKQFNNAQQLIDISHLKKGSYFYQVVVDETTVNSGKLVIQ